MEQIKRDLTEQSARLNTINELITLK